MGSKEILENTVSQAISDFDGIESAIEEMGVDVPDGTDTKDYGNYIRQIQNSPIKYVESLDTDNPLILRDFESGTYILYGKFKPIANTDTKYTFSSGQLVSVRHGNLSTCIQVFFPPYNAIQYLNITDNEFERKDAKLYYMESTQNKVTEVSETSTDEQYPTAKAMYEAISQKADAKNQSDGGQVGSYAYATQGGAVGLLANTQSGGAIGNQTTSTVGFSGGNKAESLGGGALGNTSKTRNGAAIGLGAQSSNGGALGSGAKTADGFAGGNNAKTINLTNDLIDAIQLGTGTNNTKKTFQVYDYRMMNADGTIPPERMENKRLILKSATEGSTKRFEITVSDNGNITATEITE